MGALQYLRDLHVSLAFVELIFEDLAMHDILILVDKSTHACVSSRALVFILNDIEGIRAICIDACSQDKFIKLSLDHRVDIRVDVKFDCKFVH